MNEGLLKLLSVIEKLIDTAPKAMAKIKELKDEARNILKDDPALAATPEDHKTVSNVIDKAAAATPVNVASEPQQHQ
jgi:hypothetical protein